MAATGDLKEYVRSMRASGFLKRKGFEKLLRALLNKRPEQLVLSKDEIARSCCSGPHVSKSTARNLVWELNQAIAAFEESGSAPTGEHLEITHRYNGYILLYRTDLGKTPSEIFWSPHHQDTVAIYSNPVFFRDPLTKKIFRYPLINADRSRDSAKTQLKLGYISEYKDSIIASFPYLYVGEIECIDKLSLWFDEHVELKSLSKKGARSMELDFFDRTASIILLGNPRTNYGIREMMLTQKGLRLRYRDLGPYNTTVFGTRRIVNPTPYEAAAIKSWRLQNGFDDSESSEFIDLPDGLVFALITRMPNPFNQGGVVTMISCDYTAAIATVAAALTSDAQLAEAMKQSKWDTRAELPSVFQAIYAIRMGHADTDEVAKEASLVVARGAKSDE